jgi:hypothetical protein
MEKFSLILQYQNQISDCIADFLLTTVEVSCEKEGDKKERRTSEKRTEEGCPSRKMVHM